MSEVLQIIVGVQQDKIVNCAEEFLRVLTNTSSNSMTTAVV